MKKILTDIRSFFVGAKFDDKQFLDYLNIRDDIIIHLCSLPD